MWWALMGGNCGVDVRFDVDVDGSGGGAVILVFAWRKKWRC